MVIDFFFRFFCVVRYTHRKMSTVKLSLAKEPKMISKPFHPKNQPLWDNCLALAAGKGYGLAIYRTTKYNFDGFASYAIHTTRERPFGTRSKSVIEFHTARFSKNFLPSIKGERECLKALLSSLLEMKMRQNYLVIK